MTQAASTGEVIHLRAHLGVRLEPADGDKLRGAIPVASRTCTHDGSVSLGAVATMVDVAALFGAKDSHPGALVTSHLALRLPAPPTHGVIHGDSDVVRAGRAAVVSVVHLSDDDGRVVGVATVTAGALSGQGDSHRRGADRPDDDFYAPPTVPGEGPPIDEFLAMEPMGESGNRRRYRVPFIETLRNVNGVLHGGGASLLVEQAARQAATDAGVHRPALDALDVHFVAPGLVGPFVVTVESIGAPRGRQDLLVELLDEGRASRLVAVGMVGLDPGQASGAVGR